LARNFKETVNAYMLPIIEGRFMVPLPSMVWSLGMHAKPKFFITFSDDQIT
jgi:hypothetical protein